MSMDLDRLIGIFGLLLSIAGIALSSNAPAWGMSGLILGLFLLIGSVWYAYFRKPYKVRYASQRWKFEDPFGKLVKGTRIVVYKIQSKNLTAFQTRGMRTTGAYKNFESNIGHLNIKKTATGRGATGMDIQLNLSDPPSPGSELTWITRYDNTDAFEEQTEGISFIAVNEVINGEITIEFHKDRFPNVVDKVISHKGQEEKVGSLKIANPDCPIVFWRFNPEAGCIYTLAWSWPTISDTDDSA